MGAHEPARDVHVRGTRGPHRGAPQARLPEPGPSGGALPSPSPLRRNHAQQGSLSRRKAFERLEYASLRFNFRGVGRSAGAFGDGVGEAEDVRAALEWMAHEHPGLPLVHCGFSFGNAVGTPVAAADSRVDRLICLGTPTRSFPFERLTEVVVPKLFVQGEHDEHGPLVELREGLARVAHPRKLVVVRGADHFFAGHLDEMESAIVDYLSSSEGEPSSVEPPST